MNFQQLIDYFRPTHVRQVKSGTFLRTRDKRRFKKTIVEHGVTIPFSKRNPAIQSNISNEIAHTEPKSIGSKAALAENWLAGNLEIPPIGYELLKDAKVFGGRITERGPGWHKSGQLVLTRKNEIVHSALGLMDGHPTYPANLCHPVKNGYQMSNTHHLKYLPGVYYLVGNVHYHFGHVVLEGLTRLWAMSFFPQYQKQLWYIVYESEIDGYAQDLLSLVGVSKDKIIFMTEPIVVETLIVPDAAMCTHSWLSTLQIGVWDKIRMSVKSGDANRKVFFSRRNVSDRPVSNQDDVEDHFRSLGYEIVSPERLSVYEQVKLAAESQSIAGFEFEIPQAEITLLGDGLLCIGQGAERHKK